jgi:nitrite reductase/ring-hydroxylating ferredoxin subunit
MTVILHGNHAFDQITVKHPQGYEIILVKIDGQVHGYRNSCPHIGIGLDYGDGRCLHNDKTLICSLHGALFEADTGYCVDGPCAGESLIRIPVMIDANGRVISQE